MCLQSELSTELYEAKNLVFNLHNRTLGNSDLIYRAHLRFVSSRYTNFLIIIIIIIIIVSTAAEFCQFWSISQGSAATHLRCGGKYGIGFAANFLKNRTVTEF